MDTLSPESSQRDPLLAWCRAVAVQHADHWPVSEPVLAEHFVRFFGSDSFGTFESICQFCTRLGIEVSERPMPADIRGGATYGLGGGAGSFAGKTYTWIIPLPVTAGRFCLPSNDGAPGQMPTGAGTYFVPEPGQPGSGVPGIP